MNIDHLLSNMIKGEWGFQNAKHWSTLQRLSLRFLTPPWSCPPQVEPLLAINKFCHIWWWLNIFLVFKKQVLSKIVSSWNLLGVFYLTNHLHCCFHKIFFKESPAIIKETVSRPLLHHFTFINSLPLSIYLSFPLKGFQNPFRPFISFYLV